MKLVFLLDVDNTLLDNDELKADLATRIEQTVGPERARRFWEIYEDVRQEQDFVDYPLTVQRWAAEEGNHELGEELRRLLDEIPFTSYLYPHVMETLDYLWSIGTPVILSDGDSVFQPYKISRSGLGKAVHENVLVYVHKEEELPEIFARYPADHYVVVDDKPRIISALEECCPSTFTTVLVRQGKYGQDTGFQPKPDFVIDQIADLRNLTAEEFLSGSERAPSMTD